jgi:hypothetical protein
MNERDKALSIIGALANGADPTSGELLPAASPYNNPGVIRALLFALNRLEQEVTTWNPQKKDSRTILPMEDPAMQACRGMMKQESMPASNFRKGIKI